MLKIISLRDRFARTAASDIKCYKVLERKDDPNVGYSPYQSHPFTLKHEETAILKRKFFSGEVEHGIHAFLNLSDANKLAEELVTDRRRRESFKKVVPNHAYSESAWNWLVRNYKTQINKAWRETPEREFDIFECVVPQGAKYYKGVWGAKYPGKLIPNIAATRLTVLRGINDVEEVVVSEEQEADQTVEQTVEERLASIAASVAAMPASQETMQQNVTPAVQQLIQK